MRFSSTTPTSSADKLKAGIFLAFILLIAVVTAESALAASDEPEGHLPNQTDVASAIESGEAEEVLSGLTNPSAAENVPLENIQRDEALALLNGVFRTPVEAAAGIYDELQGARILSPYAAVLPAGDASDQGLSEEEPNAIMDEHGEGPSAVEESGRNEAAEALPEAEARRLEGPPPVTPSEVAEAGLINSTIPIEVGADETLDLSLQHRVGYLEPVAPLVQSRIPENLGEKIELPEIGVGIEVVAVSSDRAASVSDGSVAFYPNVAEDSDFAISPTPTGIETMTQLRSAASPNLEIFHLALPPDAVLVATEAGGAEVRLGEEVLLTVPAPVAIDASGTSVPAELEVAGDNLRVRVDPGNDVSLPILVDPLFQTYEWAAQNTDAGICSGPQSEGDCMHQEEWSYNVLAYGYAGGPHLSVTSGANGVQHGIHVHAEREQRAGDHAAAVYTVPRYFKETPVPTSYIKSLKLSDVDWEALGPYASPYLFMGIWDSVASSWVSYFSHSGQVEHGIHDHAYVYEFFNSNSNGEANTHAKAAEIGIFDTEAATNSNASAYIGAATVELGDQEPPQTPKQEAIAPWVNQTAPPLSFSATDAGLGVYSVSASTEEVNREGKPLHTWTAHYGCIGVGHSACPRTWKSSESGHQALTYEPNLLPSGIDFLKLVAEDPVGNRSASSWAEVLVDHIAPSLTFTGSMAEQDAVGTRHSSYTLKVTGSDGDAEHPQSGIVSAELKLDGKTVAMEGRQAEEWAPGCTTRNCGISTEWTLDSSSVAEGKHTVEVIATDQVGNVGKKTLTIEIHPAPRPSLNLSGSLTEQGMLGTSRPRYALKATASALVAGSEAPPLGAAPAYNSSLGSYGEGSGQFLFPADVATDAAGNVWVLDNNRGRLQEFDKNGAVVRTAGTGLGHGAGQLSFPAAFAIDPGGNLWVADQSNNRIVEFNEKGEFVKAFGTNVNQTKVEAGGSEAEKNLCTAASGNVCQMASAGSAPGQLKGPRGIALTAAGTIWVVDSGNNRLEKFDTNGGYLATLSGEGTEPGKLKEPTAITVAPHGSKWVADTLATTGSSSGTRATASSAPSAKKAPAAGNSMRRWRSRPIPPAASGSGTAKTTGWRSSARAAGTSGRSGRPAAACSASAV